MVELTKEDLEELQGIVGAVEGAKNIIAMAVNVSFLFTKECAKEQLASVPSEYRMELINPSGTKIGDLTVVPKEFADALVDRHFKHYVVVQLVLMAIRDSCCRPYGLIESFCKKKDCLPLMKEAPWYNYARLVRNALSHDFHISFTKANIQDDVEWNGVTIPKEADGKLLTFEYYGSKQWLELHKQMIDFLNKLPSNIEANSAKTM